MKGINNIKILYDDENRLFCEPYGMDNLFKIGKAFRIKRCWFEQTHYIIPPHLSELINGEAEKVEVNKLENLKYAL